jgi:hypothetical protein
LAREGGYSKDDFDIDVERERSPARPTIAKR